MHGREKYFLFQQVMLLEEDLYETKNSFLKKIFLTKGKISTHEIDYEIIVCDTLQDTTVPDDTIFLKFSISKEESVLIILRGAFYHQNLQRYERLKSKI